MTDPRPFAQRVLAFAARTQKYVMPVALLLFLCDVLMSPYDASFRYFAAMGPVLGLLIGLTWAMPWVDEQRAALQKISADYVTLMRRERHRPKYLVVVMNDNKLHVVLFTCKACGVGKAQEWKDIVVEVSDLDDLASSTDHEHEH